jgi:hypothetical protein
MGITRYLGPAVSASGDRTIAVMVAEDGRVMYDWWDLGEGGQRWQEISGGLRTKLPAGVGFVESGRCAFVAAEDRDGKGWLN